MGDAEMGNASTAMAVETPATKPYGYLKIIAYLFFEPSRAFRELSKTPRWLVPLVLCSLVAVGFEAATSRYRMADLKERISNDSTLSPQEVSRRLHNIDAQRTTSISYTKVALGAAILTGINVMKVIAVSTILLLSTLSLRERASFKQLFSAVSFIFLVTIPEKIIVAALMVVKGSYDVQLGPAAFVSGESEGSLLITVLERLDIFSIWIAILMVTALPIVTGISKRRAAVVVCCLWAGWLLLAMLPIKLIDIN
ncbi:MAG: YIP1 family protein [Candidatus Zixiibacteriota bacterium]